MWTSKRGFVLFLPSYRETLRNFIKNTKNIFSSVGTPPGTWRSPWPRPWTGRCRWCRAKMKTTRLRCRGRTALLQSESDPPPPSPPLLRQSTSTSNNILTLTSQIKYFIRSCYIIYNITICIILICSTTHYLRQVVIYQLLKIMNNIIFSLFIFHTKTKLF